MPHFEELFAQFNGGDSGSAVVWGDITGTLADQTDLQAALDAKLDDSQADTFGLTLLATATAADARTALALVPGTDVQPYDADLTALAGLATAADTLPYFTGAAAAALTGFTAFARTLLDDANALTARATLGLVIGTDVQAQDAELQAIAGLVSAADRLPYFTGSGTAALATFTAGGRALVNSAGTADTFPYFSALNTVTLGSITAAGRALIDDASASDQRTTLGLVIGTNVQAWDAELQALAGLVSAADQLPYFTGSGTAALTTLTSFARTLIDDTTAAAAATTLGLGTGDSPTFTGLTTSGLATLTQAVNQGALQATKSGTSAITPQWQMNGVGIASGAIGSAIGLNRWSADTGTPALLLSKSRGATAGTHTVVANGDGLGRIGFLGSDGAAFFEAARIEAVSASTPGTGSVPGLLTFSTTAIGGGSATTALTLNSDQSALFGAYVTIPTTLVVGNTAGIPANTRALIDRIGSGTLPTLPGGTALTLQGNNTASNNNYLVNIAGTTGQAGIRFGDSGGASQGRIDYDNATDSFSFFTNNASAMTLSSGATLTVAGGVTTGAQVLASFTSASMMINTTGAGQGGSLWFTNNGTANLRWRVVKNSVAESAADIGSDFSIIGYNDAGVGTNAIYITRGSWNTDFAGAVSAVGGSFTDAVNINYSNPELNIGSSGASQAASLWFCNNGVGSTNRRWRLLKGAGAESGSNVSSDFAIVAFSDTGVQLGIPLLIERATSKITLAGDLQAVTATFSGVVGVGGLSGSNIYNTYTPTLTGITNVSASSANVSGWIRIGNAVLVFTQISVTATAATALTVIDISLPVASNFSAATQAVGAGSILTAGTEVAGVAISANATNDRARATFVSTSNAARTYTVVFGYIVI